MTEIVLPHNWQPRSYQLAAWGAWEHGALRLALAWHRRAGKDDFAMHGTCVKAHERVGTYWHMLPEAAQARKAIWDAINPHTGKRRIDEAFPEEIRAHKREQDMFIGLSVGSTWQVVGSDNFDSLVGSPPVGVVFSEYALANPAAWAYLRPILAENGGWAAFISTYRGRNHMHRLTEHAMSEQGRRDGWFGQVLTVEQTGAISREAIERERRELIAERGEVEADAIIQQEYFCNPDASLPGTYYAALMRELEAQQRIGPVPWDPMSPVQVSWDLGVSDSCALWFVQFVGREARIIDYLEGSGVGLDWYAKQMRARPYIYASPKPLILPHDARQRKLGINVTTVEQDLRSLGFDSEVLENTRAAVWDRIQATRRFLPSCAFNTRPIPAIRHDGSKETQDEACERMARGLDALRQYRREWNDKLKRFDDKPLHDWTSHASDSFGYLAQGAKPQYARGGRRPGLADSDYAVLG